MQRVKFRTYVGALQEREAENIWQVHQRFRNTYITWVHNKNETSAILSFTATTHNFFLQMWRTEQPLFSDLSSWTSLSEHFHVKVTRCVFFPRCVSDEDAAVGTNIRPLKTSAVSRPVSAGSSTLLPAAAELSAFTLDSALRKPGGTNEDMPVYGDPSYKSDLSYIRSRVPSVYVFHLWKHTKGKIILGMFCHYRLFWHRKQNNTNITEYVVKDDPGRTF